MNKSEEYEAKLLKLRESTINKIKDRDDIEEDNLTEKKLVALLKSQIRELKVLQDYEKNLAALKKEYNQPDN